MFTGLLSYSLVIALVAVQLPVVICHDVTRQGHVTHLAHVTYYVPSLLCSDPSCSGWVLIKPTLQLKHLAWKEAPGIFKMSPSR